MKGYQQGKAGGNGGKGIGNKQHTLQEENRRGDVKSSINSIRNVEAKALIWKTHGHEVMWGNAGGRGDAV